jgi:hypothetical protein
MRLSFLFASAGILRAFDINIAVLCGEEKRRQGSWSM